MKKSVRLTITGSLQSLFFKQFIKENADANDVRGFLRNLEGGKVEVFLEGNLDDVNEMIEVCSKGPKYANIRSLEQKEERFQDFKEFKVLKI
ncbi:MAG: acylphosphatase [Nanoarchaeota archaeon]